VIAKSSVPIGRADPGKEPLKLNVFTGARIMNTALCPMFPYLGDGDMVPAISAFYGGPGRDTGVFTHTNSVDEIYVMFGVQGAPVRAGDVMVGGREHVVGNYLQKPDDPDSLMTVVVIQRQAEKGVPQAEVVTFICSKCQDPLYVQRFAGKGEAPKDANPGYQLPFENLVNSARGTEEFNQKEGVRTCKKCGHQNARFPIELWGWQNYEIGFTIQERSRGRYFDEVATTEGAQ
jgi:hypothetical protein